MLTGHSHQAWPDVAREGVLQCWDDAAARVDDKWGPAFEAAEAVRAAVARQWSCSADELALGQNTHELVTRFLSALDLRAKPRVVTTSGEFHSMFRQLSRLAEEGLEVVFVDKEPLGSLAERLAESVDQRTAALMCSTVLFETSTDGARGCAETALSAAHRAGAASAARQPITNSTCMPISCRRVRRRPSVHHVGGGYKYAQWGEGCCFLRVPPEDTSRPLYTGWFASFAGLADPRDGRAVGYGERAADRFAGSTYDPTSHYRARAVIDFFGEQGLDVATLRAISLRQTGRVIAGLEGYEIATPTDDARRGGFVSVRVPDASRVVSALRERGVFTDARGELLRFGPAPYVTDDEIDRALSAFRELAPL